jgi:anti-sigma-K factor RskA
MEHLSPDSLASLAVDPEDLLDQTQHQHLAGCDVCRGELDQLRRTATIAWQLRPDELEPPPPTIWSRIVEELKLEKDAAPNAAPPLPRPQRRRIGRDAIVAIAAALILIVGVGAGVFIASRSDDDSASPAAKAELQALPGKQGSGIAELSQTSSGSQLQVRAEGLPKPDGFYETWLINVDGKRLVALGNLPAAGDGSFTVPAGLVEAGYRIVDVSLEPLDGDPAHSQVSIIRGTLPA